MGSPKSRKTFWGEEQPPEKRSFCRLRQNEQKGRVAPSGQPGALLAPDKVREIGKIDAPANAPNSRCFLRIGVYPTPRRKRHKSPVNRRQGRKERLGRTDWGYTDLTVTNGTFVTGRKGIFDFQQSGAVAAVTAKTHAEIGKAVFP